MAKKQQTKKSPPSSWRSSVYLLAWVGLAALSLIYLADLLMNQSGHDEVLTGTRQSHMKTDLDIKARNALKVVRRTNKNTWSLYNDITSTKQKMSKLEGQLESNDKQGKSQGVQNDIEFIKREVASLGARLSRLKTGNERTTTPSNQRDLVLARREIERLTKRIGAIEKNSNQVIKRINSLQQEIEFSTASLPKTALLEKHIMNPSNQWAGEVNYEFRKKVRFPQKVKTVKKLKPVQIQFFPLPEKGFGDQEITAPDLDFARITQASRTLFGIQLGQASSKSRALKQWTNINKKKSALLGPLEARYIEKSTSKGRAYQLIAGPFSNVLDAVKICAELQKSNLFCEQTIFVGTPF